MIVRLVRLRNGSAPGIANALPVALISVKARFAGSVQMAFAGTGHVVIVNR